MIRLLRSGAAGMAAQSVKVDTIANNIANINTEGFKKKEISFQDLVYQAVSGPGQPVVPRGEGMQVGTGVRVTAARTVFSQGLLKETGRELDFAIEGEGFFRLVLPDGSEAFTRAGGFYKDAEAKMVTANGYTVDLLPASLGGREDTTLTMAPDGRVYLYDMDGELLEEGTVQIYRFQNPGGLEHLGENNWQATVNSGDPVAGEPHQDGFGTIRQGMLESSNVSLLEEVTRLIMAQRAYELSARTIRTADEMWAMANQIRK
jgi:flagellar basal-body rod protein FlgG